METDSEKVNKYLEAAKINQENLWKRRRIEWRTSFSLWAAIGTATGFIFMHSNRLILIPQNWIILGLIFVFIVYGFITWLQYRYLKIIFISNEKDLDFINYFVDRALWFLDKEIFEKHNISEPIPKDRLKKLIDPKNITAKEIDKLYEDDMDKDKFRMLIFGKGKFLYILIITMITVLIEFLSLCILTIICFQNPIKCCCP